jgi:hypothetical protein
MITDGFKIYVPRSPCSLPSTPKIECHVRMVQGGTFWIKCFVGSISKICYVVAISISRRNQIAQILLQKIRAFFGSMVPLEQARRPSRIPLPKVVGHMVSSGRAFSVHATMQIAVTRTLSSPQLPTSSDSPTLCTQPRLLVLSSQVSTWATPACHTSWINSL